MRKHKIIHLGAPISLKGNSTFIPKTWNSISWFILVVSILWMHPSLWFSTGTKLHTILLQDFILHTANNLSVFSVHHNSTCTIPYAMILEFPAPSNSITITQQFNKLERLVILCICMFTVISISSLLLFLNKKISCSQCSCGYLTCNFPVAMSNTSLKHPQLHELTTFHLLVTIISMQ